MAEEKQNGEPRESGHNGRDASGRFLPGHPGGPGRPPKPDFLTLAKQASKEHGCTLEEAMVRTIVAQQKKAEEGDSRAAEMLWTRVFGPVLESLVQINQDNRSVTVAELPSGEAARKWVKRLAALMDGEE